MRFLHQTGCTISDEWTYKGMRVIWLENAFLRIGILPDRGADIFEFRYKPKDINILLNLPGRLRNLSQDFAQMRNTENQFEDHYYGGWQEILPNSPAFTYRRASLGQHGEVSLIPWKYSIVKTETDEVSVRLSGSPVRFPIEIVKTISLKRGESNLEISETLYNKSSTDLDMMWGHHIALGAPFIEDEIQISTNARHIESEPEMPAHRRFTPGVQTDWPNANDTEGESIDASIFPKRTDGNYSELSYLTGYEGEGQYSVRNPKAGMSFDVTWNAEIFKCLWMWQERNATKDFPWWGDCYTLALEPWTSKWTNDPESAIERGEWLRLHAGTSLSTSFTAGIKKI